MVGIKDVAKKAGVSVTTVSRVMNSRGYISIETREKVEQAMKDLDYQPNQIARALQKSQSFVLGVIVPDLSHPVFAELISSIEADASTKDYKLLVCNSLQSADKEMNYIKMLRQNRVDGIIMCSHTLEVDAYRQAALPIVSFDRILSSSIPYVACDNYRGGEVATRHLVARGCKRLLHISGPLSYDMLSNRRTDAFQLTAIKEQVEWKVIEGAHIKLAFEDSWEFIEKEIAPLLGDYDGVFCSNDIMAYTLYTYAVEHGIDVPGQLKIVGFDYHSFTRLLKHPVLTTIKQPLKEIGTTLSTMLIAQIENGDSVSVNNTVYDVELIIGETT